MPKVERKHKYESIDSLIRRFKRSCEKADLLIEIRKREFYEQPSSKRKRKKAAAVKREQRRISNDIVGRKRLY